MNLLKYSNGVGHLIMSVLFTIVGVFLLIYPGLDTGTRAVGLGFLATVSAAWFIPGAAKQVANQVSEKVDTVVTNSTPTDTGVENATK